MDETNNLNHFFNKKNINIIKSFFLLYYNDVKIDYEINVCQMHESIIIKKENEKTILNLNEEKLDFCFLLLFIFTLQYKNNKFQIYNYNYNKKNNFTLISKKEKNVFKHFDDDATYSEDNMRIFIDEYNAKFVNFHSIVDKRIFTGLNNEENIANIVVEIKKLFKNKGIYIEVKRYIYLFNYLKNYFLKNRNNKTKKYSKYNLYRK